MRQFFYFSILLLLLLVFLSPQVILARGTDAGTVITNAQDVDFNDVADQPGEVIGSFTNIGGYTNYAKATNITTSTVAAGYDLSVINQPADGSGGPGTYVEYTYIVSNWGNVSAQMIVRISSNASDPQWGVSSYELWTNFGAGFGLLSGAANWISNELISVTADAEFELRVRVNIPVGADDATTNEFKFEIWDLAWTNMTAGDQWPGSGAILPATTDLADAHDYQTDYITTTVMGPVIQLTKSVDITSARPYEVLTYTIHYTNAGSGEAFNVTIDDAIYTSYVRIITNSAEINNTTNHSPTNYYYDGATWQPATWDTPANVNSIERVRWQLQIAVQAGQSGDLEFKVIIK